MLKIFDIQNNFYDEPSIRIIDRENVKGLVKQAMDLRISKYASKLSQSPDKIYAHILAMGASEYYGCNLNCDYFPEDNLIRSYKTFETNPAHFFKHHVNKDKTIAMGKVIFAIYNERMHRVELVVEIDRRRAEDIVSRIERGEYPSTSMACKVASDTCSICGNVASTRAQYCKHLRQELGHIYPDGRRVYAINEKPLSFHDISYVFKGADPTSSFLQKLASDGDNIVGSAERAEQEGVKDVEKYSSHKKVSELVKEVADAGHIVDTSGQLDDILNKVRDPEERAIDNLLVHSPEDVFTTMAAMGISPSVGFLAEIIGRKHFGHELRGIGKEVERILGEKGMDVHSHIPNEFSHHEGKSTREIAVALAPSVHDSSMLPKYVEKRSSVTWMPGTNVGYSGNGPKIEPTVTEKFEAALARKMKEEGETEKPSLFSRLIALGAAALAAKWYITSLIKEKIQEEQNASDGEVKIVLVKKSSDYRSTYCLSTADTIRTINKYVR
jgi:hypothetical protein